MSSRRYFRQVFDEAGALLSNPELTKLAKNIRDSRSFEESQGGQFTTEDLLGVAAATMPGSALAKLGSQIGHPKYQNLSFEATAKASAVVLFLDVRGFTKLSIELENDELIRILQRLSIACVSTVYNFGGYIGDFTGDGIMAFFDDGEPALNALATATELLTGVRDDVNSELKRDGDTGIKVAAGLEFGEVWWARIGLRQISQVKPVSEVTYVAGKLATSEHTEKWECCVGEQLAQVVPSDFLRQAQGIPYRNEGEKLTYKVFKFDWEQFDRRFQCDGDLIRKKMAAGTLSPRVRRIAPLIEAPSVVVSKDRMPEAAIPGPADAPVPPKSRQVG